MELENIIIRPLITEKSMAEAGQGIYSFVVNIKANKPAIKKAIEDQFKVNVLAIKTIVVKGKTRLAGRLRRKIKTSNFKKAKVALKKDQKIEIFETNK